MGRLSNYELFVAQSNVFSGFQKSFENADYVVLGVPFDVTSTYRTGARFGPTAIRQGSLNIETYSFRSGVDVEDIGLHDLGDLPVSSDTKKTLEMLELVIKDIAKAGKIVEVGTRAVCKEELAYAKKAGVEFFTTQQIRKEGSRKIVKQLRETLAKCKRVYLSVGMDVLDPAYVPAAQNPEADGLDMGTFLDILESVCDKRVTGFDVLAVAPNYDQGISAIQAAKVIFEILARLAKIGEKK